MGSFFGNWSYLYASGEGHVYVASMIGEYSAFPMGYTTWGWRRLW